MKRFLAVLTIALAACTPAEIDRVAHDTPTTIVSLTFDDTFADQFQVAAMVAQRGMHATFFVNSGRVNGATYMTQGQLLAIQQQGNEIAGHTVSHADLPTLDLDEERRQICNDRVALLGLGFAVSSFAYPFGDTNPATEQIVADCGYDSARGVGDLVSVDSCNGCAFGNPVPPADPFHVKTPDSIKIDTTLATLEGYVTQAELNGGGWVPLVMHHVCDGCDPLSVSPATLTSFLDWLAARAPAGTVVETIHEVIGGDVKPGVAGPPAMPRPPAGNLLANPSLETDSNGDGIPDCWQRGGSGVNAASFTLTNAAFDGAVAQRLDVTSFASGARRLVSRQDLGSCAPTAYPGHVYTVSAEYLATTAPRFTIYYRTATGGWVWWAQSPLLPTSASYVAGSYTVPALPAGATSISVGLSIFDVGSITMDAFSVVDTDTTPPTVALVTPTDGATVGGIVELSATASDDGGVDHVDFLVDGAVVGSATAPYAFAWDTRGVNDDVVGLVARAVDLAGNVTLSTGRLITISNVAPIDDDPPSVALSTPGEGAVVRGLAVLAATASDDVAVQHVEFLVDDQLVGSSDSPPYQATWDSTAFADGPATLVARAFDTSGNAARSVEVHIIVDHAAPAIALTAPVDHQVVAGTTMLAATASDDVTLARVEFFIGAASLGAVTGGPYQLAWDTTSVADGAYVVTAVATDEAGNQTTSSPIAVTVSNGGAGHDTTPPVSAVSCDGAACATGYYDHAVAIGLTAVDTGSGVAAIRYTLDGTIPDAIDGATYSGAITATGPTTLTYRAYDQAGNAEPPRVQVILIDTSPPVTTITCNGGSCGGFFGTPVTVALTAGDLGAGTAVIRYSVDGSAPSLPYNGPFTVATTTTLTVSAIDLAGNVEPAHAITIALDTTVPAIAATCNGVVCGTGTAAQPVAITLTASGVGPSGLAAIRYTLDGSAPSATSGLSYAGPFALATTATVRFVAIAGSGASSPIGTQLVLVDSVPPTGVTITSPAAGALVTGIAPIVATASDDVGVVRVRFYLDGKQLGTRTALPFKWNWDTSTATKGSHVLAIQAEDAAGNATRSAGVVVTVH